MRKYKWKFYLQYYFREAIIWFVVGFVVFYFMPRFDKSDSLRKFKIAGLALAALVPYAIYEVFWCRPFDINVSKSHTDYEFRSTEYAYEFHRLNEGSLIVD